MHDKIRARYILECVIESRGPIHIGAGRSTGLATTVDNPIVRVEKPNGSTIPIIPGSSIKGVLRAHFTRIFNSIPVERYGFRKMDGNLSEFEKEFSKRDDEGKMGMMESLGTLEKFFGISGLAAPIRITDAEPEIEKVQDRTHIRIDIGKDRVQKSALFSVEFVEGLFRFKIVFDELDSVYYDDVNRFFHDVFVKTLKSGLEIHLGGMKSRGYGLCMIRMEKGWKFTPEKLAFGENPDVWEG